jgi:large subunit ribosomal protein L13e
MVKHNNSLLNAHFKKKWQTIINNWFNQAGRKNRNHRIRLEKINICLLRPYVSCQTIKYNLRRKIGRGFTSEELKMAAISPLLAYMMGIALDYRRKNRSQESLKANVARLTDFRSRIAKFKLIKKKKEKKSYCILNKPVVSLIHNILCNTNIMNQ